MSVIKKDRNIAIAELRDSDSIKYSFGVLGDMFKINKVTVYQIYHREKGRDIKKLHKPTKKGKGF